MSTILYKVAKELWDVKQNKNIRRHSNQRKMYREIRLATRYNKEPKKILKTMSKLYGFPTDFFGRLLKYERIDEYGEDIKGDRPAS